MADVHALVTGRSFLEGPRWHDGALYVSNMHGDAVLRVSEDGEVFTLVELRAAVGAGAAPRKWPGHPAKAACQCPNARRSSCCGMSLTPRQKRRPRGKVKGYPGERVG